MVVLLATQDIATRLGISPETVRRAARRGLLTPCATTVKGIRLFNEAGLEAWVSVRSSRRGVGR